VPESIFGKYEPKGYPYVFRGHIIVELLAGGTPTNPDVAAAWIKAKGYKDLKDELIAEEVSKIMAERGVTEDDAIEQVSENRHLSGFRRDEHGLYIEGRQLKAMLKEAASVAADVGKLQIRGLGANPKKGIKSFVAEHIFVREQRLHLGADKPSDVIQSFIHTFRGSGIQYTEVLEQAEFDFTVETDRKFDDEFWAMLWLTGQRQGIGATRSQGFGAFTITEWEPLGEVKPVRRKRAA
jgi:hypothetical protein